MKTFLWTLSFFFLLATGFTEELQDRIRAIDQEIEQLQEKKRGFEGRALRHENMAEYMQFDDRSILETRRHLQLAEENRAKASAVQLRIDELETEKRSLMPSTSSKG